jgi:hypothetical protein
MKIKKIKRQLVRAKINIIKNNKKETRRGTRVPSRRRNRQIEDNMGSRIKKIVIVRKAIKEGKDKRNKIKICRRIHRLIIQSMRQRKKSR